MCADSSQCGMWASLQFTSMVLINKHLCKYAKVIYWSVQIISKWTDLNTHPRNMDANGAGEWTYLHSQTSWVGSKGIIRNKHEFLVKVRSEVTTVRKHPKTSRSAGAKKSNQTRLKCIKCPCLIDSYPGWLGGMTGERQREHTQKPKARVLLSHTSLNSLGEWCWPYPGRGQHLAGWELESKPGQLPGQGFPINHSHHDYTKILKVLDREVVGDGQHLLWLSEYLWTWWLK